MCYNPAGDGASPPPLAESCRLVAGHYFGAAGVFAYQAFDHLNDAHFDGALPCPLITWALTPHGRCLASTRPTPEAPVITLHPGLLGGRGERTPWGIDRDLLGPALVCDVLLHECAHLAVALGGNRSGPTSHNDPAWIEEVNRLAPRLGLEAFVAGRSGAARVPVPDAPAGVRGRPPTVVRRVSGATVDGEPAPFAAVAGFPFATRRLLGATDVYSRPLPFPHALETDARRERARRTKPQSVISRL